MTVQLTNVVIGLSDVMIPHGDIQSFLGELAVFDVIAELLQSKQGDSFSFPKDHAADPLLKAFRPRQTLDLTSFS